MEPRRMSARTYHRVTAAALVALAFIVVTGAAVRLTGSGLGCPDWPACAEGRLVAPLEYHPMIEFVNRVVTGLVSAAVALAVLGSFFRSPRRRDLTLLSVGLVAGVVAQILLGALVVRFHLAPPLVMGHFIVSMLLLLDAAVLHHRAGEADGPSRPVVGSNELVLGRLLVAAAAVVISLGTVVTGAGPHAGSHEGQLVERLPVSVGDAARAHGSAAVFFVVLTLFVLRRLRLVGAPRELLARGEVLLAVLVAQAAVGYAQYFTGVPALLVAVHVAGSVAVWLASLRLVLAMRVRTAPERAGLEAALDAV